MLCPNNSQGLIYSGRDRGMGYMESKNCRGLFRHSTCMLTLYKPFVNYGK